MNFLAGVSVKSSRSSPCLRCVGAWHRCGQSLSRQAGQHRGVVNGTASLSSFAVDAYLLSTRRKGIIRVCKRVNAQDTSAELEPDLPLEIAHVLLIDVVGYSKLLVNEQIELLQDLNQIVRNTECFRAAETKGRLIRVSTGDGMALLFFHSPEEPVRCALEISKALQEHPHIQVRMGVHSGPVNQVTDVNDKTTVAGAGINVAQRVMDCGDAGHILLSGHIAEAT